MLKEKNNMKKQGNSTVLRIHRSAHRLYTDPCNPCKVCQGVYLVIANIANIAK